MALSVAQALAKTLIVMTAPGDLAIKVNLMIALVTRIDADVEAKERTLNLPTRSVTYFLHLLSST